MSVKPKIVEPGVCDMVLGLCLVGHGMLWLAILLRVILCE
jgi:hypothetical protein